MISDIIQYHERTKHHPYRYARSLGFMDWDTQPDPFRRYQGAPLHRLAIGTRDQGARFEEVYDPTRHATRPVDKASIGDLFFYSLALSATKEYQGSRWHLRCNPSSGNLHPTEGYLVAPALPGVHGRAALYHYAPYEHGLERLIDIEETLADSLFAELPGGSCLVGLSSIYWRESWKYGERAFRYCHHDVGHAIACIALSASLLGWRTRLLEAVGDAEVATLLSTHRQKGIEAEHADCLLALFPAHAQVESNVLDHWRVPEKLLADCRNSPHAYQANRLSEDHHEWPIIDEASHLSEKPALPDVPGWPPALQSRQLPSMTRDGPSAREIIRTRRSVQAMDGVTEMEVQDFLSTLARLMPNAGQVPFNVWPWCPAVHPVFAVHRVRGLASGLYCLVRDPDQASALGKTLGFAATRPAVEALLPGLPLYLIDGDDYRQTAENLSCGQEIASGSCFAVMMVSRFAGPLSEQGPWFYRRLHWETGMIGQVLYLEAEARGLRGTGIGCFFDDSIHELLGLEDYQMQSLYNFTVGGSLPDSRLTDLPAYAHLRHG